MPRIEVFSGMKRVIAEQNECEIYFSSMHHMKVPVHKIILL